MITARLQLYRVQDCHQAVDPFSWCRLEDFGWENEQVPGIKKRAPTNKKGIQELLEVVNGSRWILKLSDDWDGEGTGVYSQDTWQHAKKFILDTADKFAETCDALLPIPRILPGPMGSIDLHWKTDKYELLINIPADISQDAEFYGDDYGNTVIRGSFSSSVVQPGIITWFKER